MSNITTGEQSAYSLAERFRERIGKLRLDQPRSVVELVDALLLSAREAGASDVHLVPFDSGLEMSWRIDGVLQPIAVFPQSIKSNVVARLKVLAELLTYQTDMPQEGRIRETGGDVEMRVSTFPTLHGEKAVVRLFAGSGRYDRLDGLGLPDDVCASLKHMLEENGGIVLVTGPAGSGKTTTIYACLRELVNNYPSEKSLVSLEDPIESALPGVAQSQIQPATGFDYATGLRSLMRQDPEVILVGEIRDRETAETVFQAALTGHLVLTTFHSGSAAGAISRLSDMGIEPYLLRSGILGIVGQRLVRRLCSCAVPGDVDAKLGLDVATVHVPVGCPACAGTGYRGRMLLAELLLPDLKETGRSILARGDAAEIEELAVGAGMISRWRRACEAVEAGLTSPAEVRRVLGFR